MLENDQLGNGNWLLTDLFLKHLVVGWENISRCTSWIVVKGNLKGKHFHRRGGVQARVATRDQYPNLPI